VWGAWGQSALGNRNPKYLGASLATSLGGGGEFFAVAYSERVLTGGAIG